jgi:hypothetical protein
MKAHLKVLIIFGILIAGILLAPLAFAAPISSLYRSLIPEATDQFYIGTSSPSLLEWNGAFVKNLTISGTCTGCTTGVAGYPFPLTGNATSTLTQFNGGLTAYASSTIGDGTTGLTVSGALTYGRVTLSNAVTGTGNMVLSASPTFTGTATFGSIRGGTAAGSFLNIEGTTNASPNSSSGIFFRGGSSGTTNLAFLEGDNGNLGIGSTTTPYAKLAISGFTTGTPGIVADALLGFTGQLLDLKVASTSKFVVDQTGTITTGIWGGTAIANGSLANSSLTVTATSPLTGGGSVSLGGSTSLGCQSASGSQAGCLSSVDWTTFNNKNGWSWPFPSDATTTVLTLSNGASVPKLTNLTSNGFVKTSGGTGALSIDTSTYLTAITGGTCTNQFVRAISTAGATTCATVANTDLANSSWTLVTNGGLIASASTISLGDTLTLTAKVSTSSVPTVGNIPYWTGNGTPSTLGSVGTSSIASGVGITVTNGSTAYVIGSQPSIACNTATGSVFGCLTAADWTTFNGKESALTFNWPLVRSTNTISYNGLSTTSPWTTLQLAQVASNGTVSSIATSSLRLTTSSFNSANVSQWTNDSGYIASITGGTCTNQFVRALSTAGATTCATVANTDLANSSFTLNGTSVALGDTKTITAASSTLLANNNTFSGSNIFSNAPVLGSLTGIIKGSSGTLSAAANGTDYTLITAKTCTAGDFVSSVTAAGVFTCTTPVSGSTFPFTAQTYGVSTSTTVAFLNGLFSTASSTFGGSFHLPALSDGELAVFGGLVSSGATTTAGTGLTYSGNAFNVNSTQSISRLSNLTTNGFVKTGSANGTLSIDTSTYLTAITGGTCTNQFARAVSTAGAVTCATVANTDLANSSITVNGTSFSLGDSKTITAASSTLLANNNTFSGTNTFSNSSTSFPNGVSIAKLSNFGSIPAAFVYVSGGDGTLSTATSIGLTTQVSGILPIANGGTNNSSAYTAGSLIFSNGTSLTEDNANLFYDSTNARLGLNTITPTTLLNIAALSRSSGDNKNDQLTLTSQRIAISTTAATNLIGGINFDSNDTSYTAPGTTTAAIKALASAAHTANAADTDLVFYTSSGVATSTEKFRVDATGHIVYTGVTPTVSACGTSPSITGNDDGGVITTGTVAPTACTVTFATAWTSVTGLSCQVTTNSATIFAEGVTALSTTAFTVTFSAGLTSGKVYYHCALYSVGT